MEIEEISVVIPAYNESMRISNTLAKIFEYLTNRFKEFEVIVVDDGSKDETVNVVKGIASQYPKTLHLIENPHNRGKGYATKVGALSARFPYVLLTDADLSTPIDEIQKLAPYASPRSVVIASRGMRESNLEVRQPFYRETMGRVFNLIVQTLLLQGISDTQCGFKLFGREVVDKIFPQLFTERFAFDVEILVRAKKEGFEIHEVPVRWRNDERTRVHAIRDSFQMLLDVLRIWWKV